MSENTLHSWLARRLAGGGERVLVGAGADDCAHLDVRGLTQIAVSVDTLVEGTHFRATDAPFAVGGKAVLSSLSDLAASGCRPLWGVVALTLRRGAGDAYAQEIMAGIIAAAETYHLAVVGGDTTSAESATTVGVTVIGAPFGERPLGRRGAQAGDILAVTGELGGSLAGRHLCPAPRFAEIKQLLTLAPVHACLDISDGLALDLHRLLAASGVGAEIDESAIPLSAAARAAPSGKSATARALGDGEDFELLFAVSAGDWEKIAREWKHCGIATRLTPIGRVTAEKGARLITAAGVKELAAAGYEHRF
ncbi:MAG: thiamine-phosphate kinase [Planctomycetota bacterium]|jgi:thiamine-monophosphate kinase|nr:thiamine-phosphate kinase [Planctomycetota bacterium]